MAVIHITAQGDALDLICHRHYGRAAGAVEQVLVANPGIAATAHRLQAGISIALPDLTGHIASPTQRRLWD